MRTFEQMLTNSLDVALWHWAGWQAGRGRNGRITETFVETEGR